LNSNSTIQRLVLENEKLKQEKLILEDKIKLLVEDTAE
jgi:cell division protein FtsB